MKLETTTIAKQELSLDARTKRQLSTKLDTYAELTTQIKALEHARSKIAAEVDDIREEAGVRSLEHNGFKVTVVSGITKRFNPKVFVQHGGDLDIYNSSFEEKSKRPFTKITCPGVYQEEEGSSND